MIRAASFLLMHCSGAEYTRCLRRAQRLEPFYYDHEPVKADVRSRCFGMQRWGGFSTRRRLAVCKLLADGCRALAGGMWVACGHAISRRASRLVLR
jgi:hypothetical protein